VNPKDAAKYASIGLLGTGLGYAVFGVLLPMVEDAIDHQRTSGLNPNGPENRRVWDNDAVFSVAVPVQGTGVFLRETRPVAKYGGAALGLATGLYLAAPKKKVRK
jgi:hypothetical protein